MQNSTPEHPLCRNPRIDRALYCTNRISERYDPVILRIKIHDHCKRVKERKNKLKQPM